MSGLPPPCPHCIRWKEGAVLGWPCASAHRLLARESRLSQEARFLGGELRAECRLRLEEWLLCFFEFVSFWSWLWPGSLLPSFCSWSCSLWEGNVFLIVLIRNLLFVPARGHFILWGDKREEQTIINKSASYIPSQGDPLSRSVRKNLAPKEPSFWFSSPCHAVLKQEDCHESEVSLRHTTIQVPG